MRIDKPKVGGACTVFLVLGIAGIFAVLRGASSERPSSSTLVLCSLVALLIGVVFIVVLANDPSANKPGTRGILRRTGRAHVLEFPVGDTERHTVRIQKRRSLLASFANPQPLVASSTAPASPQRTAPRTA